MKKKFFKVTLLFVMVSLLMLPALYAGKKSTVNLAGFPGFVEKIRQEWEVPGCAVVIVKDGKVIFSRGFGFRDAEQKLPVTPNTLFAIGSCTKAFTAVILGTLVDEGKLDWDKPVRDYLPSFQLQEPTASRSTTPVDLVTHRCGLPRHDMVWYNTSASREELVKRLRYLEPSASFRYVFRYNNLMFMAAGYMAGKIAGTSWEDLVQKRIFTPLGMKTSNFSVNDSQKAADFSLPYSKRDKKIAAIPFRNIDAIGPAGSINSSVAEMANWLILNLNKGKFGDKQVISEVNLKKIHSPQMVTGNVLGKYEEYFYPIYGMGWMITSYRGHLLLTHGGGIDGFVSQVSFLPRENAGVVILTNSDDGGDNFTTVIGNNVFDRILGLSPVPWDKRIREAAAKSREKEEEAKKQPPKEERILNTAPSHKLEDYTGEFENPGYGILSIKKEGDQLMAAFNEMQFKGEHYHYDIFEFTSVIFAEQKLKFTFHTNLKGDIGSVSIPLQPDVKDIEFTRMTEKKMQDKAFLEQFVGEYDFQGMVAVITLKGDNTLILNAPGQPPYELAPYRGVEFNLKDVTGFSIKFILDDTGKVTGLESHQPNGTFNAKKKN